jgi:hypothetical protein
MVICHANSGQNKIDHLKFRVELVKALLKEYGSEIVRDFQFSIHTVNDQHIWNYSELCDSYLVQFSIRTVISQNIWC